MSRQTDRKVNLISEGGSPYGRPGIMKFRDVSVDPTTSSVILRMEFANPDGLLLPGMFVRVSIPEGVAKHAILIPQQSVSRNRKGQPIIYTVNSQSIVEQRQINIGRAIGDQWLVLSGLSEGDRVIVEGTQRVRPDIEVNTVPFESAPTGVDGSESAESPSHEE